MNRLDGFVGVCVRVCVCVVGDVLVVDSQGIKLNNHNKRRKERAWGESLNPPLTKKGMYK